REDELAAPVDYARLERKGADREQDAGTEILNEIARAPVDAAAIAFLIKRAERDADQREKAGAPAKRRARHNDVPVVQHQDDAEKPEREAEPLKAGHRLAHKAIGNRR